MKATQRLELWERLRTAGLVRGEAPQAPAVPWFVRLMLGLAGWIGASFIMGFIMGIFPMLGHSSGAAALAALLCCAGAGLIFRLAPNMAFASQFGLAVGLAGQALLGMAIFQQFHGEGFLAYLLFFAGEVLLTGLLGNFTQRIFTTLGAGGALYLGLAQAGLTWLALPLLVTGCALVWQGEERLAGWADLWQPVGYGLALGVLLAVTAGMYGEVIQGWFHHGGSGWLHRHGVKVGTALVGIVFLAVTMHILRKLEIDPTCPAGLASLAGAALIIGASFPAPGLSAALLLLLLGFAGGNRLLLALGLLALAAFLSLYYYRLEETLLFKAQILSGTGALLLLARLGLGQLFPAGEGQRHA